MAAAVKGGGLSPPSRRRGLKHKLSQPARPGHTVASLAEAWIGTMEIILEEAAETVASLAEAWIETPSTTKLSKAFGSPPSRRRGLKRHQEEEQGVEDDGRLPRGGVD